MRKEGLREAGIAGAALALALVLALPAGAQNPGPHAGDGTTLVIKRTEEPAVPRSFTWDRIAGNWKAFRGRIRQQWGKLTHDDLAVANGKRDVLVGKIQARYGIDKDKADQQVELWLNRQQ